MDGTRRDLERSFSVSATMLKGRRTELEKVDVKREGTMQKMTIALHARLKYF